MPLDVGRAAARLPDRGRLQVAARAVRARLPLRRARASRRASRWSRTGSRAPARRTSPAWSTTATTYQPGRAALRHGPANELSARADGDRGDRAAARVGGGADRGHARRDDRGDRRGRGRARARAGRGRRDAARTCSVSRCPPTYRLRPPARSPPSDCYAAVRGDSLRIAPHLHNTPAEVDRLLAALATATAG